MRQVSVDARDKDNRAEQFKVVTTILDASIDGGQIGDLYERRWDGEVDIRSIKSTMKMDILRCKTPEMVREGDLGSPAGVQPAPHGHGGGRQRERRGASRDQLQGSQAGPDGVRAEVGGGAATSSVQGWLTRCSRRWRTTGWATGQDAGSRGRGSEGRSRARLTQPRRVANSLALGGAVAICPIGPRPGQVGGSGLATGFSAAAA